MARHRSRLFFSQRNYEFETHNFNEETKEKNKVSDETQEEWKERVLQEIFSIDDSEYTALIFHNRDVKDLESGELKGLHCHFILKFANPRSYDSVLIATKSSERNFETSTNEGAILRYLTHTTVEAMRDQKTRYEVREIYLKQKGKEGFVRGEDLERWYRVKIKANLGRKKQDTNISDFVSDLSLKIYNGELKKDSARVELIKNFGENLGHEIYRKEAKKFEADYEDFLKNRKKEILKGNKKLSTIYIDGDSAVGKSIFAKDLANAINLSLNKDELDTYFAPAPNKNTKSWDWASDYKDENVTVFNDLDPFLFAFTDFLATFETKQLVEVSSRYRNKTWFSDFAIITKSTDVTKFVDVVCRNEITDFNKSEHYNIRKQVQRRITLVIKIENNKLTLSQFNKGRLIEKEVFTYKNIEKFWSGSVRQKIIKKCLLYI